MVRHGGYNSFSFREVAQRVGIKSSSVHYYFPTKEDLGVAVAKHYTDRFMDALGAPEESIKNGVDPIRVYVAAFKHALIEDKRMCLCGLLGAEVDGLPEKVAAETKAFFSRNLVWLEEAYSLKEHVDPKKKAIQTLALLEGALMASNVLDDIAVFDQATEQM